MKVSDAELAEIMNRGGRQNKKHETNKNNNTRGVANMEQHSINAAKRSNATKEALPRVVIRFTHYRRRFADVDNFATKHFVDSLVKNGLLRDDSPKEVEEVRHRQVKIEQWEDERVELELFAS